MRTDFKYATIVFEVNDHKAFEPLWNQLFALFKKEEGAPFRVSAVSVDDEIERARLFEEANEKIDDHYDLREAIKEIASCPNISDWSWDQFE